MNLVALNTWFLLFSFFTTSFVLMFVFLTAWGDGGCGGRNFYGSWWLGSRVVHLHHRRVHLPRRRWHRHYRRLGCIQHSLCHRRLRFRRQRSTQVGSLFLLIKSSDASFVFITSFYHTHFLEICIKNAQCEQTRERPKGVHLIYLSSTGRFPVTQSVHLV